MLKEAPRQCLRFNHGSMHSLNSIVPELSFIVPRGIYDEEEGPLMSRYSIGRATAKEIIKADRRRTVPRRLQKEAAARPESKRVVTPSGEFWMSPIEAELYEAMCMEGLIPVPQYCVEGYYVDFAFPDVRIAVEADGREFHSGERRERDKKRDWVIRRAGWSVKRFYGDTIYHKAPNCAYIIKKEVSSRRYAERERERQKEIERKSRNEAIARPFRKIAHLVKRGQKRR